MTQIDPEATEPSGIDPSTHADVVLENALLRAGVDLDSPQGGIIARSWAGRNPDIEAIKSEWAILNPPAPEPTPAPELSEVEGAQATERQILAAGGNVEPPPPPETDPRDEAVKAGYDVLEPPPGSRIRKGTNEDAVATGFHKLAQAASDGDTRVLVQEQ